MLLFLFLFTKHIGQAIALFVVFCSFTMCSLKLFFDIACDNFAQRREVNKRIELFDPIM